MFLKDMLKTLDIIRCNVSVFKHNFQKVLDSEANYFTQIYLHYNNDKCDKYMSKFIDEFNLCRASDTQSLCLNRISILRDALLREIDFLSEYKKTHLRTNVVSCALICLGFLIIVY